MDKALIAGFVIGIAAIIIFFIWWFSGNELEIINTTQGNNIISGLSPFSGLPCAHPQRRPIAVMMAADNVARPLTAITKADAVFEMPVTPDKTPRYMAIFQCQEVDEIGSIRSAREDFLPLVGAFNAIYVHWGGEKEALARLNNGILDNIDGLKYDGTVFYRKKGIPMPHNGFTKISAITEKSEDLAYKLDADFIGYPHLLKAPAVKNLSNLVSTVEIDYQEPYQVKWIYDDSEKIYKRLRGGTPEIDRITGEQVSAGTIVVMETTSKILNQDYINVDTKSGGAVRIYEFGTAVSGYWKKGENLNDRLVFIGEDGKEIEFAPGVLWVHIETNPK